MKLIVWIMLSCCLGVMVGIFGSTFALPPAVFVLVLGAAAFGFAGLYVATERGRDA